MTRYTRTLTALTLALLLLTLPAIAATGTGTVTVYRWTTFDCPLGKDVHITSSYTAVDYVDYEAFGNDFGSTRYYITKRVNPSGTKTNGSMLWDTGYNAITISDIPGASHAARGKAYAYSGSTSVTLTMSYSCGA